MLKAFEFEGNSVTFFDKEGTLWVNATEMAKPFGDKKRPTFWLRSSAATDYINEVADVQKCTSADLQRVTKGGNAEQGTWFQKDVALEFARWLSPKFALWCNKRIEELLTTGRTELQPQPQFQIPQTLSEALMLAARQAKQIEHDAKLIETQRREMERKDEVIEDMREGDLYLKKILASDKLITTNCIAQDYGYSAMAFNRMLHDFDVQYKRDGQWLLTYKYRKEGYVHSETFSIKGDKGSAVITHTKWTQKGRRFLYEFLKKRGILPTIERRDDEERKALDEEERDEQ